MNDSLMFIPYSGFFTSLVVMKNDEVYNPVFEGGCGYVRVGEGGCGWVRRDVGGWMDGCGWEGEGEGVDGWVWVRVDYRSNTPTLTTPYPDTPPSRKTEFVNGRIFIKYGKCDPLCRLLYPYPYLSHLPPSIPPISYPFHHTLKKPKYLLKIDLCHVLNMYTYARFIPRKQQLFVLRNRQYYLRNIEQDQGPI
jgi:hypothetical protein